MKPMAVRRSIGGLPELANVDAVSMFAGATAIPTALAARSDRPAHAKVGLLESKQVAVSMALWGKLQLISIVITTNEIAWSVRNREILTGAGSRTALDGPFAGRGA